MALILNLYKNGICTESGLQCGLGVAGITGTLATKSNWIQMTQYGILFKPNVGTQYAGVVLSGATPIFNLASIPDLEKLSDPTKSIISDKASNSSSAYVYNAFFGGIESESGNTLTSSVIEFYASNSGSYPSGGIRFRQYTQTPVNADMQSRQTWSYQSVSGYDFGAQMQGALERCICVYKINIWETDYYLFAIGVSAGGDLNSNLKLVLIPISHFKDREIKPYVGPVSKESSASAFIGSRSKDRITPRDLTITPNPYGFNSNGVYLCDVSASDYLRIVGQLYNGLSGSPLNIAGQVISATIAGNSRRPRDEVQTMIDGILCCHYVPVLGGYPQTGSVDMTDICGYSMFTSGSMTLKTVNPIHEETITTGIIPRQTGNYLDFSPYTTCVLTIPILGDLEIDPSALLGNSLSLHFGIDLYAGVLSCDVCIIDANGGTWIYATMQGNCVCDMPIAGAGAQGNPLLKIAGGIAGLATGNAAKIPISAYQIFDGAQSAAYSTPIKRAGNTNAGILISPYKIYLTVTTPNNSNAEDFWNLAGVPSHMSGNVGSFSGFTIFEHVDLSTVSGATESELQEIENTLYGGVWL